MLDALLLRPSLHCNTSLHLIETILLKISTKYVQLYFGTALSLSLEVANLEKLAVLELVKKFPQFYGTRSFRTIFKTAHHFPPF